MFKLNEELARLERHPKWGPVVQFLKFGLVGVSNTIISLLVYYVCFYGLRLHYQLANLLGFVISVTNAYYWNNRFVFKDEARSTFLRHIKAYCRSVVSYGFTYLLSIGLLYLWVDKCGISEGIAPLLNLIFTIPINFFLNKRWAFKKQHG